jgi:hypothetical protein
MKCWVLHLAVNFEDATLGWPYRVGEDGDFLNFNIILFDLAEFSLGQCQKNIFLNFLADWGWEEISCYPWSSLAIDDEIILKTDLELLSGEGKTTYLLSASFRYFSAFLSYIWQAILT